MSAPETTQTVKSIPREFRRALTTTAWIAGVFTAVICVVIVYRHITGAANDPWKSPQLLVLKERLAAEPKNERIKEQIRELDLEFRQKFRRRLEMDRRAGWLLVGAGLLLAMTARRAAGLNLVPFLPTATHDPTGRSAALQKKALKSVAYTGVSVVLALAAVGLVIGTGLPKTESGWNTLAGKNVHEAPADGWPALTEMQANWPRFRGWDGGGVTSQTNYALAWDRNGIKWKSPIVGPGHSSPVVWGNRVFLSGGTAEKREAFCYDAGNGRLLWRRAIENVPGSPAKLPEVSEETGFAASTGATDGRHFFVMFANGDLGAVNFDGTVAWSKSLGPMRNMYGHASSLAVWQGRLIIQLDQGEGPAADSKLLAIDCNTGRVLWTKSRPVPASWATPIVIESAGKTQIVTLGQPWVICSSFTDGNELWRADLLENEVVPSPVFAGGTLIAVSPSSKTLALRPEGAGDVTKTGVLWSTEEDVPDIACPVSNSELVFTTTSGGLLTCFDGKTGEKLWRQDLNVEIRASPSLVGSRLFIISLNGTAIVVEAGRRFQELARSELGDKFVASPAFAAGRIFLRGETNLYCIGTVEASGKGGLSDAGR